ncbi:hypothetical protein MNBD_NITROSPIRAE03-402 [hydrothermal vent metagenome]|uniref:Uncharacterized protein n=1 Tax=hydrothermal vent metagenome TaxID=652676 RepID=A0A3B1CER1_9ZZZZ
MLWKYSEFCLRNRKSFYLEYIEDGMLFPRFKGRPQGFCSMDGAMSEKVYFIFVQLTPN